MEIIREIIFDIDKNIYTKIDAKQNDTKSRFIKFTLINNGLALNLTGHTVKIYAIKSDNTLIFNNVVVEDAVNGKILVELTSQALSVAGDLGCELVVYGADNSVLSTKSFIINVIKSIRDDSALESTNEFTGLTQALSTVQQYDTRITDLENNKTDKTTTTDLSNKVGTLTNLSTTNKSNLVSAINENVTKLNDKVNNTDFVRSEGYATDTGVANAYVITLNPAPTAYVAGQSFKFKATNANTGTSTLNVNGLGAKTIKKNSNVNLVAGNILAGQIVTAVYDGTYFQIREDVSSALTDKASKTNPAFISATLTNGWIGAIQYSKNDLGIVTLKINAKGGTVTADTIISTLPTGYKPTERVCVPTVNMITGAALIGLVISTTGDIAVSYSANFATNQSIVGEVLFSTL